MSHRHLSKAETAEVLNHHAAVHHFITASEVRQPTGCLFVPTLAISNQDTSSKRCYILVTPQSVSNDLQKTLFLIWNWLERGEYNCIHSPRYLRASFSEALHFRCPLLLTGNGQLLRSHSRAEEPGPTLWGALTPLSILVPTLPDKQKSPKATLTRAIVFLADLSSLWCIRNGF